MKASSLRIGAAVAFATIRLVTIPAYGAVARSVQDSVPPEEPCVVDADCEDELMCNYDICDPQNGCVHPPDDCSDGNPCTADSCDEGYGCVGTPTSAPCSDGNACTGGDHCNAVGACAGTPLDCNDGSLCTTDSCSALYGCVHSANTCASSNQCTNVNCDPSTGACSYVLAPNGQPCFDGILCTVNDTCDGQGVCVSGPPPNCFDDNPCTDDSCRNGGCPHQPLPTGSACDDGNLCTAQDACTSGASCFGYPVANFCQDGIECTLDYYCDPSSGACAHPQLAACSPCNGGAGTCDVAGACVPVTPGSDPDNDGRPNGCDCLPDDPTAFALPPDLGPLTMYGNEFFYTIDWTSAIPIAGSGTRHDLVRGFLPQLPSGSAGSVEVCLVAGIPESSFQDPDDPHVSNGFWYLVRAKNACGVGTYGFQSDGAERQSSTCP